MSAKPIVYKNRQMLGWTVTFLLNSLKIILYQSLKNINRENTLLQIANARSHSTCDILNQKDKFIKIMFLPSNVTSFMQPLDQGVIECFKRLCRKDLFKKLLFTF